MAANTKKLSTLRVTEHDRIKTDSTVVKEFSLTIVLNGQELVTLLCSPTEPQFLAVGFVQSQRLIENRDDIKNIVMDEPDVVRIETKKKVRISAKSVLASSGAKGVALFANQNMKTESRITISPDQVFSLINDLEQRCETYVATGGTHSAAFCDANGVLVFSEDIGRHNALDKVFGQCLLQDIGTDNGIVLTSGRVSSEILLKVATRHIPVLISRKVPTDLGVKLASDLGMTLVGSVRGTKMTVYANDWRIVG